MSANVASALDASLFSGEHAAYRQSVRAFLARHVIPDYGSWTTAREIPRAVLRQAGEDGFLGMGVPEQCGGIGIDDPRFGAVLSSTAMEAGVAALALALAIHNDIVVPVVATWCPELSRERWLNGLATGDIIGTLVEGDVEIGHAEAGPVINGTAKFTPMGAGADLLLVSDGAGAAFVELGAPGVTVRPSPEGIGLAAVGFADLEFSSVTAHAIGPEALDLINARRDLCACVTAAGGAREALALTLEYVRERQVFGVPLGSLENTREVIATMVGLIDSATAVAEQSLRSAVSGTLTPARAAAGAVHCINVYRDVADRGIQLHGGYGYMLDYPISRAYADSQFWALQGDVSMRRRDLVAGPLLD